MKNKGNNDIEDLTNTWASPLRHPAGKNTEERQINNIDCLLVCVCVSVYLRVYPEGMTLMLHTHTALPNWWIYWNASSEPENVYSSKRQGLKKNEGEGEQRESHCRCRVCRLWKLLWFLFDYRLINRALCQWQIWKFHTEFLIHYQKGSKK